MRRARVVSVPAGSQLATPSCPYRLIFLRSRNSRLDLRQLRLSMLAGIGKVERRGAPEIVGSLQLCAARTV